MTKRHKRKTSNFNKLTHRVKFTNSQHRKFVEDSPFVLKGDEHKPLCKAYIYESELSFLGKCILDSPHIETGGQLFGYWTASGAPVVVYAIGPGPKANHQVAFFNQDVDYLKQVGGILVKQFGLMHIGEWHSHHQLGLDKPSGHDANTMQNSINNLHLNRFLLCIGNCNGSQYSIKPYNFIENQTQYMSAQWEVKGDLSPLRPQIDNYLHNLQFLNEQNMQEANSWYSIKSNRLQLKKMIDFMKEMPNSIESKAQLVDKKVELITQFNDRLETISFPPNFPVSPISIFIEYNNGSVLEKRPETSDDYDRSDLFEVFKQQYQSV